MGEQPKEREINGTTAIVYEPGVLYKSCMGSIWDNVVETLGEFYDDFDVETMCDDVYDAWAPIFERYGFHLDDPYMQVSGPDPIILFDDNLIVDLIQECQAIDLWEPITTKNMIS